MGGDADICARREKLLGCEDKIGADRLEILPGDLSRFAIDAFADPNVRDERQKTVNISDGAVEVRLEYDTNRGGVFFVHLAEELNGVVCAGVVLHIDAHEVVELSSTRDDSREVFFAQGLVDVRALASSV